MSNNLNLADSINFAITSGKTPTFIYNGTTYQFSPAGLIAFLTAEADLVPEAVTATSLTVDTATTDDMTVTNALFLPDIPTVDPGVDDQVWSDSGVLTMSVGALVATLLAPDDDEADVAINANLVITFNRNVAAGTGNVELYDASDDSLVEAFDITSEVTIDGDEVTINPTSDLDNETSYYVLIDAGAIVDASVATIEYAGITSPATWSFTTVAA